MGIDGAKIILGTTGSIAVYKVVCLGRELIKNGAEVRVIMTENSARFVSPMTFRSALSTKVLVNSFEDDEEYHLAHIKWAEWADLMLIAPATANFIAKAANGIADDLLSTTLLAARCQVVFVPAMNTFMYLNPVTVQNIRKLEELGYYVMPTESGELACGEFGAGRFPKTKKIVEYIEDILIRRKKLKDKKILITAGPTREYIDPVRFISNASSGLMGVALSDSAMRMGASVTLIHGPIPVPPPPVKTIEVTSADEMYEAVLSEFGKCDVVLMAAAVADFSPQTQYEQKMKKENNNTVTITLSKTPDILAELGKRKKNHILVGFSLETENIIENAQKKLFEKNLDLVIANKPSEVSGPESTTNEVTLLFRDGKMEKLPVMSKRRLARIIMEKVADMISQ